MKAVAKIVLASLVVLALAGCSSPFPPQTLVERLRILAIRAEPPEAGPLDVVTLDALVVDPAGDGRSLECNWAVCLVDLGWAAGDIDCPGGNSYPLEGDCQGAAFNLPELVAWLEEQGYDINDLPQDLPPELMEDSLPLFVGLEVRAGDESTRGIKRVRVNLSGDQPNTNPALTGLEADGEAVQTGEVFTVELGVDVELTPLSDESTRQTYRRGEDEEDLLEDFLFSWFSTSGEFEDRRTILDVDSKGRRLDINDWKLRGKYAFEGQAKLWLIVRDGRYGVDWLEFSFEVMTAD
ncbi:MAG TPA: hypothetical protein VM425_11005 [Myxococcota bacterium]|nr:hypothetical protein [Myxococcota bacterium]